MSFSSKYILLLIFLFKPIYNDNCRMETHTFYLLPLKKEKESSNETLTGLNQFDYMLFLKTENNNANNYHLVFKASFPININIDLSPEIIYQFTSSKKFCVYDLKKGANLAVGPYKNIIGNLSEFETKNDILHNVWIKIEELLINKEIDSKKEQKYILLTNFTGNDEENKRYVLMKRIINAAYQNFQIVYASITKEKNLVDQHYVCEEDPKEQINELSIGDELSLYTGEDRLRETIIYSVFDHNKKKYTLSNINNLVCLHYELKNYYSKC